MDKDELYSLYQGLKLLEEKKIEIFGIERDEDFGWSTTSEQYPPFKDYEHDGEIIKSGWHCHGVGKTPKGAIIDMIKQVKKYLKNK